MKRWNVWAGWALLGTGLLVAGQKWVDKDFHSWTEAQAQQLLLDSPWARQVGATIFVENRDDPRDRVAQAPLAPGQNPSGPSYATDGYGVDDGHWDGGVMKKRHGEPPTVPVTVRWASALPIREALLKTHDPDATDTENTLNKAESHYILTVFGLVPAQKAATTTTPPPEGSDPAADLTRMRYGFLNTTRLLVGGKKPIVPEDIHVDAASGLVTVYFPKGEPIVAADKEVEFRTSYGGLRVAQRFRLKDMMSHGQLEL